MLLENFTPYNHKFQPLFHLFYDKCLKSLYRGNKTSKPVPLQACHFLCVWVKHCSAWNGQSPNSTWFWLELVGNCCEQLKIIMKCTNIQFCERLGHGWQFHPLHCLCTLRTISTLCSDNKTSKLAPASSMPFSLCVSVIVSVLSGHSQPIEHCLFPWQSAVAAMVINSARLTRS